MSIKIDGEIYYHENEVKDLYRKIEFLKKDAEMISNSRIQELKNFIYNEFLVDNMDVDIEKCVDIFDCLSELSRYREVWKK